jgi:superfamily I DNA/RNA helicase
MKLPTPIGRQKEVLCLPAKGHFVVLGTAGSGKTTLAILRSAYLGDPQTDHHGKTLLVTFNRALVAYLKHLQDRRLINVIVENYHTFARGYLASRGKMLRNAILSNIDHRKLLIAKAVDQVSKRYEPLPLFGRPVELFSEEFRWIAQHGIADFGSYRDAERIRQAGVRIERRFRSMVWEIYEAYLDLREKSGKNYDWDDLALAVSAQLDVDTSPRRYRHVVIDEGQDFSPEMIRSLAKAIPPDGSLTFFGDVAQQIYGHRMSWRSAGLKITKKWEFRENYRNSRQIARLGLAISKMPYFKDVPDIIEPVSPAADGPLPTLVECSSIDKEIELAVSQAVTASRTLSVAILLRNRQDEEHIRQLLPKGSIRLHREMTTWQAGPGIRYGTYHSAKGLEFDMVILPFCSSVRLPDPEGVAAFGEDDALIQDGRLLYVGVTRAKTRLIITYSGDVTCLFPADSDLYTMVYQ